MTTRKYTSRSQQTTLTAAVTSGATSLSVVSSATLLGGITISAGQTFTVVIDPDTALEEVLDVTAVPSTNVLTVTRQIDGSTAQDHSSGAVIRHMIVGRDLREANAHIEATTGVHGTTSAVVGKDDTQILTAKTISGTSNTITNIASGSLPSDVVYKDVAQTLTVKTLTSPTINSGTINTPTIAGATLSGTFTSTATVTGGTLNPTTLQQNGVQALTTANTATVTNKTLTSPIINGGTVSSATVTSATIASGTLSTDLAAGGFKVTGLGTPTVGSDSATKTYVDTSISNLVASAPSTLDTLNELALALGSDPNFATTITTSIATKLPKSGGTMTGAIDMGTSKITNLGTPSISSDAVTLGYVTTLYGSTASAATSATSAAASATAAATSASSSLTSQTAAATSATSAAASATAAATSATSAAASATAAATSASSASVSQSAAATSATSAAASATAAATSASSASASQTYANTYASNAATSATSASVSATASASSATAAATSATSSATSATSSATTYNIYKTWYLGTFASPPTLDNQGNALITGATYFNSGSSVMYVYSGSTWSAISSASSYTAPTLGSTTIASGTTYATLSGLELTNGSVTADPTTNLGIASKQYVDNIAAGLNTHDSVQAATTSAVTGTYTAGSTGTDGGTGVGAYFTVTATGVFVVDGYSTVLNDRVLIKDQANAIQNGIYKVTTAGTSGISAVLTRATDYDNSIVGEVFAGDIVFIIGGTRNINQGWVMNAVGTSTTPVKGIKIGTDNIAWTQFTGASLVTAGNGLNKTGDTLSIDTAITVDKTTAQTLTNKTLTSPVIGTGATFNGATTGTTILAASATASGTLSLPAATDTLVGKDTTDTLTNKTLSSATFTGTLTAGASSGTNGQYLQSTATGVQWSTISALPSQTGNSGKYLTTNGTAASWGTIATDPTPTVFMLGGM